MANTNGVTKRPNNKPNSRPNSKSKEKRANNGNNRGNNQANRNKSSQKKKNKKKKKKTGKKKKGSNQSDPLLSGAQKENIKEAMNAFQNAWIKVNEKFEAVNVLLLEISE